MPEHLMPIPIPPPPSQQSHAQNQREEALRRLSRSPHPYHRQRFELPHASEKIGGYAPARKLPLASRQNTDDDDDDNQERTRLSARRYHDPTPSDSGTEADDEHFLKGLPAPRLKPHKGLRGSDGTFSGSPSPLPSPAFQDGDIFRRLGYARVNSLAEKSEDTRKVTDKFRRKRKVEIIRRISETAILGAVGGIKCGKLYGYGGGFLITISLVSIYPLRLLRHINPSKPWKRPFQIAIPSAFDPAPLLYPSVVPILASLLLSASNPVGLLPSIILGICSLPKQLVPSTGGPEGGNICHWLLSCLPVLLPKHDSVLTLLESPKTSPIGFNIENLVLLHPLHLALCDTLHYLTTTSLLPAELQLLSISLIELLLLGTSPQAVILKSVLWGCGIGILITCTQVLGWGVTLARVPKWRFRRSEVPWKAKKSSIWKSWLGVSTLISKKEFDCETSSDELFDSRTSKTSSPNLVLKTRYATPAQQIQNGSISAIDTAKGNTISKGPSDPDHGSIGLQRRHTLPAAVHVPERSSQKTPSGRKKRSASSSVQSFFSLTQSQASIRKWLYAAWVYACIVVIILGGIREYIAIFALDGNEPIGWALGYLFGDIPWFRMHVVTANLQRWIILPTLSGPENQESCLLGWVEHLRHASFGKANTRLILCGYWLGIITVGLSVVFRLSAIYEVDTRRKVFHFMMVAMLLPATFVDPTFAALALSLMLAIFLLLDLFRATQLPPLSKSLAHFLTPYVDGRDLKGPVVISHIFLLIGCAIPLWLSLGTLPRTGTNSALGWEVPIREVSMVSGVICVGLGDAAASLIGRRFGRRKWVWGGGKSVEGSVAFAAAVHMALIAAKLWLRIGDWPANNEDPWMMTAAKACIAAGIASLTEAVLTGGNDNVVVPVVLWLCVKGLDI
ncbi:hypothetical protein HYFRA_00000638 [Hymenoscyphus fraxineus]|uniref:dolichol kinase n=1 Tax=Hymenoscyphus fraxineus TaxID=746836 RepID=A0A9N9PWX9_9HELO|nr:hypothetical protein HYFRA_00000638 [Hymenoscyphus fraxineus]